MRDNKHYEIHRSTVKERAIVCFSLDRARPDSYMNTLEQELQQSAYLGEVLLDLFATNGNNYRRFMRLSFDGSRLHWLQAKIAKQDSISADLLEFCNEFYLRHPDVVENSVLSKDAQLEFLSTDALA